MSNEEAFMNEGDAYLVANDDNWVGKGVIERSRETLDGACGESMAVKGTLHEKGTMSKECMLWL
jgi:hypothetical protein